MGFDRSLIVLNYLTLFAGVAISVLGCVVFCLKGRGVGSVIALLVMAGLALILCFLSMIVGYETVMREGNYALVVVGLALTTIVALAAVHLGIRTDEECAS